ncbi:4Fe-4S binding protein [candidate division KSB1 bacterium]|nr:4Fe-4S binding protein [candidate division KSB1 bacterium]
MEREIITIDEDKCNGCGLCVPGCPEGALQIIDGKARLISDLFCDGLGACIGECPEGAIEIEKREAEPYDERTVMENIIKAGPNTIKAHLAHLKDHGETAFLKIAVDVLKEKNLEVPQGINEEDKPVQHGHAVGVCPGSKPMNFNNETPIQSNEGDVSSQLTHWPVQLHLVSPRAPYFEGADVLLAADCTAYALGDFHQRFLKEKALAIACPKLDEGHDIYLAKLIAMIDDAKINTLTVLIMQVPCCGGLIHMAKQAAEQASRKIPIKKVVVGIKGEILSEDWV